MKYTKIPPPKFFVRGETLNEYEVRQLQVDVKNGKFRKVYVTDEKGTKALIKPNGKLSEMLYGLDFSYTLAFKLME